MVKYPAIRREVLHVIQALSNPEYQQQAWINHVFPEGVEFDCFDYAVHVLFDDTG